MKLILENIGKIKKAEIDLDHQLTVFFGPNNTGKTYVSYCLYGYCHRPPFIETLKDAEKYFSLNFENLFEKGSIEIDLVKFLLPLREKLKDEYAEGFRDYLPQLFGNYISGQFDDSFVSLSCFENEDVFKEYLVNIPVTFGGHNFPNGRSISFEKDEMGVFIVRLGHNFDPNFNDAFSKHDIERNIKRDILQFTSMPLSCFFIPAERIGISVFGKELILNRFSQTNSPNKREGFTPYSLAVFDAIRSQFEIASFKGKKSDKKFFLIAEEIEKEVLNGKLSVNEAGDIFYGYDEKNVLPILNSASTIKSLSSLVFYLRYFATDGQCLFIDEPEINLHPENQRKVARILAKISNLGIQVYVSTHSDYIIREFNNLMMLGKEDQERENLMHTYGYNDDEVLDYKKVGAYFFNNGFAKQVEVGTTGFAAETIDETINSQNKASNDIMFTLFES